MRPDGPQEYLAECRAAVVTEVPWPEDGDLHDSAGLAVLNPTGMFFRTGVPHVEPEDGRLAGGTWHWPERA